MQLELDSSDLWGMTKLIKNKDNPGFKPVHKAEVQIGLVPIDLWGMTRWLVERTNAWVEKCRVLWKNCERYISTSVAKLQLCLIRLQIKRLAREK